MDDKGWLPIIGGPLDQGWYYPPGNIVPFRHVFLESDIDGSTRASRYRISRDGASVEYGVYSREPKVKYPPWHPLYSIPETQPPQGTGDERWD